MQAGDAEAIGRRLHNRLQRPGPGPAAGIGTTGSAGCRPPNPLGSLVSGSGSTVFALARDAADARRIAAAVRPAVTAAGGRVVAARTL